MTSKLDRILTGKWTAVPCFVSIMAMVFWLTFDVIGAWLQEIISNIVVGIAGILDAALTDWGASELLHGILIEGALAGVGSVLSFLPVIVTLFFFLSMLEDSGYLARIAFVMDKLLRKLGLSGRSIVPMLLGFGCTVPAVMATRTLPSERDRKMTIMMIPFMSCTAKLTVYSFFVATFFPGKGAVIMISIYLLGIIVGTVCALLSKGTIFKGNAMPFVMELPNYRLPEMKNVAHLLCDKAMDFLGKAFIIFTASMVLWLLQSFDFGLHMVSDNSESMIAAIGGLLAPVFAPLGLNDWRVCTSLFTGLIAKEYVVSSLAILFGEGGIASAISLPSCLALLAFSSLYTPCVAAMVTIKRELGMKWATRIFVWQCMVAWMVGLVVKLIVEAFI